MKNISTQLQALFVNSRNSSQPGFDYCGLYAFTLVGGGALNFASGDTDVKLVSTTPGAQSYWQNQTFSCGGAVGPYFDRTDNRAKMHQKIGVEVDTLQFDVIPNNALVEGVPFLTAVKQGVFDGAEMTWYGAYWAKQPYQTPIVPTGTVIKFVGRVGEVDCGRTMATFVINSHLELLNQNLPINLWQGACVNTLFDTSCTLIKSSFGVAGTAASGSTYLTINDTMSQATGYFDLGTITFTSGVLSGLSRTIKTYVKGTPGSMLLMGGFPQAPAPGDTFTAYPGCDKLQATCLNKFSNLANFRGQPYVPINETAV